METNVVTDESSQREQLRLARLRRVLGARDGEAIQVACAPGRVNLIGGHTDYNEGFVLPVILDCATYAAARPRADHDVHAVALDLGAAVLWEPGEALPPKGHWSSYVVGVVHALRQRGLLGAGVDLAVGGDVPRGAGLASSAALEVAVATALQAAFGFEMDEMTMARLCRDVEHNYAGVPCGVMDQCAVRLGRPGHAMLLDCRTLEVRHVPLPPDRATVVVFDSGVRRGLAASGYADRRASCDGAAAAFRRRDPSVKTLRDVSRALLDEVSPDLPAVLARRARHVVEENERVQEAARSLARGDVRRVGALMNASHASLRDQYEVSCRELDTLAEAAREVDGVYGARLTGAGFGGSVVALVHPEAVRALEDHVTARYVKACGHKPAAHRVLQPRGTSTLVA